MYTSPHRTSKFTAPIFPSGHPSDLAWGCLTQWSYRNRYVAVRKLRWRVNKIYPQIKSILLTALSDLKINIQGHCSLSSIQTRNPGADAPISRPEVYLPRLKLIGFTWPNVYRHQKKKSLLLIIFFSFMPLIFSLEFLKIYFFVKLMDDWKLHEDRWLHCLLEVSRRDNGFGNNGDTTGVIKSDRYVILSRWHKRSLKAWSTWCGTGICNAF